MCVQKLYIFVFKVFILVEHNFIPLKLNDPMKTS